MTVYQVRREKVKVSFMQQCISIVIPFGTNLVLDINEITWFGNRRLKEKFLKIVNLFCGKNSFYLSSII